MYKSDFAVLIFPPDLGGVLISSLCDGTVLYAGSIIWAGHGGQSYPDPDTALNAFSIRHTSTQASPPQSIDVVSMESDAEGELREEGLAAWNSVSDLNLVQELSSSPYNVLIYFYSPSLVVEMDETELEWIIFVHPSESKK